MFVICFITQWMKVFKTWPLCFPAKETLIWRRHCSIGQSCCSMTSKLSIGRFLESSSGMKSVCSTNKSHPRLYPFDKPIKSLYSCSFVVPGLFVRFHVKVLRKSLYRNKKTMFVSAPSCSKTPWKFLCQKRWRKFICGKINLCFD